LNCYKKRAGGEEREGAAASCLVLRKPFKLQFVGEEKGGREKGWTMGFPTRGGSMSGCSVAYYNPEEENKRAKSFTFRKFLSGRRGVQVDSIGDGHDCNGEEIMQ